MSMKQEEALEIIRSGKDSAHGLLYDAMPTASTRFYRLTNQLDKLLTEIRVHFPDATFYSASSSVCLMLGRSHDDRDNAQQELVAHVATKLLIEGGDW